MATVSIRTAASPTETFAVLANGWRYAEWVVGTKRIRAVDPDWPAAGSRIHHAVGVGPLTFRDISEVEEVEVDRRIVLGVRVWPAGRGRVTVDLDGADSGTTITLHEVPVQGPAKLLQSPVLDALAHVRNAESLRRLKRAVEEARTVEQQR